MPRNSACPDVSIFFLFIFFEAVFFSVSLAVLSCLQVLGLKECAITARHVYQLNLSNICFMTLI